MKSNPLKTAVVTAFLFGITSTLTGTLTAQPNRIDSVRPDAPELAAFGAENIGVRTIMLEDTGRVDIVNTARGGEAAVYDRQLTVEIWYPAALASGQQPSGEYRAITRNPEITATLHGKAVRDAAPVSTNTPFPLVIISHGYPGNRYLLSHLGENLASKGYVVASIDHKDSTYDDQLAFTSTLYNRPLDQRFVLQSIADLSADPASFLNGLVDANNTGIVGYSMGGYGLVNNLGGGYSDEIVGGLMAPPNRLLEMHATGNPDYRNNLDSRIKTGFAVAPWGMNSGFWRPEDLAGVSVPTFYLAGDADTVAGYTNGTRAIFEQAVNSDRYLLTFKNAGHNAGAPYPVPVEILESGNPNGAAHYTDPVWDNVRMNNIMDHFATAWFDLHLKGMQERMEFLDLVPDGADGVFAVTQGQPTAEHTYWQGFGAGTAVGLKLEHRQPGE